MTRTDSPPLSLAELPRSGAEEVDEPDDELEPVDDEESGD